MPGDERSGVQLWRVADASQRFAADCGGELGPLALTLRSCAQVLVRQGRTAEGERMLRPASEGLAALLGAPNSLSVAATRGLAETLRVLGRLHEADAISAASAQVLGAPQPPGMVMFYAADRGLRLARRAACAAQALR